MTGYIYLITNKINQKQYVGLTTQTVDKRYYDHLIAAKNNLDTMPIHIAMNEYGVDNFQVEELECINANNGLELSLNLDKKEKYYIDKYNVMYPNGYNKTKGGSGYHECRFIQVDEYDLYGNFLNTYDSYSAAGKSIGIHAEDSIRKCCLGISKFAFQRIWRLHGESFDKYKIPDINIAIRRYKLAPIDQYDIYGNYIRTFDSIANASRFLGLDLSNSHISECCQKKLSTAYGYVWRYNGEQFDIVKDKRNISIEKYSKDDEYIETFNSLKAASISIGNNIETISSNIRRCIKGRSTTAYGFKWKYAS